VKHSLSLFIYYIASLGTYNVEYEKNFSNSNFVNQGACFFQQTKNGLRTRFKSFNRISELMGEKCVVCLIAARNFRQFAASV
jgi:hypothetical protein